MPTADGLGILAPAGPPGDQASRRGATFEVVSGLAGTGCLAFRARDGRYLRHSFWRLRRNPDDGTDLFRKDATFCPRAGSAAGSVSLESFNYPGHFVHRRGTELWVDSPDGTGSFRADCSFLVRAPLAG